MRLDKDAIFNVIKDNLRKVVPDIAPGEITLDRSMTELGANSVDRVEVVMYSLEDLNLKIPVTRLHSLQNLGALVELIHQYANPGET